jgi:hypothetical protein
MVSSREILSRIWSGGRATTVPREQRWNAGWLPAGRSKAELQTGAHAREVPCAIPPFSRTQAPGADPRLFIDKFVDSSASCPNRPFTPFSTWSRTLP